MLSCFVVLFVHLMVYISPSVTHCNMVGSVLLQKMQASEATLQAPAREPRKFASIGQLLQNPSSWARLHHQISTYLACLLRLSWSLFSCAVLLFFCRVLSLSFSCFLDGNAQRAVSVCIAWCMHSLAGQRTCKRVELWIFHCQPCGALKITDDD